MVRAFDPPAAVETIPFVREQLVIVSHAQIVVDQIVSFAVKGEIIAGDETERRTVDFEHLPVVGQSRQTFGNGSHSVLFVTAEISIGKRRVSERVRRTADEVRLIITFSLRCRGEQLLRERLLT